MSSRDRSRRITAVIDSGRGPPREAENGGPSRCSASFATTLIWLDQSSPRLRFFFVGLGVGTVEERPHPKAISRQGGSPSLFHSFV